MSLFWLKKKMNQKNKIFWQQYFFAHLSTAMATKVKTEADTDIPCTIPLSLHTKLPKGQPAGEKWNMNNRNDFEIHSLKHFKKSQIFYIKCGFHYSFSGSSPKLRHYCSSFYLLESTNLVGYTTLLQLVLLKCIVYFYLILFHILLSIQDYHCVHTVLYFCFLLVFSLSLQ